MKRAVEKNNIKMIDAIEKLKSQGSSNKRDGTWDGDWGYKKIINLIRR